MILKAEVTPRVHMEKHVPLGQVAPLSQPFVVALDPSSACNFRCKFCPTGDHGLIHSTGRYQGIMDFRVYQKVIDDLVEFDAPIKTLRLYKNGEPLVHPRFAEMVAYARQSGHVLRIDTTTNGALLTPELSHDIVDAGIDQINISVNGMSSEQMEFYTRTAVDFGQYVEQLRELFRYAKAVEERNGHHCEIFIKSIKEILSEEERQRFFDTFGEISDRIVLEHISPAWPTFRFSVDVPMKFHAGNYGQDAYERKVCPYLFYILVVNADGTCSTCIGDWPNGQIVGDVRKTSVRAIWNGEKLRQYQKLHLQGRRKEIPFCGACEVVTYGTLDDMDADAEEILKRMEAEK